MIECFTFRRIIQLLKFSTVLRRGEINPPSKDVAPESPLQRHQKKKIFQRVLSLDRRRLSSSSVLARLTGAGKFDELA